MNRIPSITDAELEILRVLWLNPDCYSSEVVQQMTDRMGWSPNTTRTLLSRLVQKEAAGVKLEQSSRRMQLFYPRFSEQEYQRSETTSFMEKMYGGSIMPMLANFLQDEKLNTQEIEDLKTLFDNSGRIGELERENLNESKLIRNCCVILRLGDPGIVHGRHSGHADLDSAILIPKQTGSQMEIFALDTSGDPLAASLGTRVFS